MPLFRFRKEKEIIKITKKDILGEWIHRAESDWIFFVFYKDGVCEYLDDEDDTRSWHYSVSGNKLKLWGSDKSKFQSFELNLNGNNLVINGVEYTQAKERWKV